LAKFKLYFGARGEMRNDRENRAFFARKKNVRESREWKRNLARETLGKKGVWGHSIFSYFTLGVWHMLGRAAVGRRARDVAKGDAD
jgi:hypothetical protein